MLARDWPDSIQPYRCHYSKQRGYQLISDDVNSSVRMSVEFQFSCFFSFCLLQDQWAKIFPLCPSKNVNYVTKRIDSDINHQATPSIKLFPSPLPPSPRPPSSFLWSTTSVDFRFIAWDSVVDNKRGRNKNITVE